MKSNRLLKQAINYDVWFANDFNIELIMNTGKKTEESNNGVAKYYSRFGSWAGYNLVLGRSQHAGYWQKETKNEKQAQKNYLEKFSELPKLRSGDRVLDAGSGQGAMARYLATKTGAEIIGMTITPREIRVSEKLSRKMSNPPKFVLGDYTKTDFPDDYFDVVYVNETLSHVKDVEAAMCEFYRLVKPGGRVVFVDYEIDTKGCSKEHFLAYEFLAEHAGGYGLAQQNPGEIAGYLSEVGFVNVKETDWTEHIMSTFNRLRKMARPLAWVRPDSKLAPLFVNAVIASHGYSSLYEVGLFRYIIYEAQVADNATSEKSFLKTK